MPSSAERGKTVTVPKGYYWGYRVPETTVQIDAEGKVWLDGEHIGRVEKGTRTYSPPTHKGSRIVRYHKRVPEWHAYSVGSRFGPDYRSDTRKDVLGKLIGGYHDAREQAQERSDG